MKLATQLVCLWEVKKNNHRTASSDETAKTYTTEEAVLPPYNNVQQR